MADSTTTTTTTAPNAPAPKPPPTLAAAIALIQGADRYLLEMYARGQVSGANSVQMSLTAVKGLTTDLTRALIALETIAAAKT